VSRETVVIAGARGFVGRAVLQDLVGDYDVVGLSRSEQRPSDSPPGVEWRAADLFRLQDLEQALEGCDRAIYLVHSMQPSARLVQGSFSDLDLLLADNFARAAARAGVKQIVYVGGLLPKGSAASPHLRSRAEVADALGSRGVPVTALRAGIIVGPGGPSLWILLNLVRRLPFMVLPSWTDSRSHPIALVDVVRAVRCSLESSDRFTGAFDIGGATVLTYREMMETVARVLHRRLFMLQVSLFSPRLSTLWVQVFGSAPRTLVAPLVRSLQHDLVAEPNALQDEIADGLLSFEEALAGSVDEDQLPQEPTSSIRLDARTRAALKESRRVRSVQRLPLPTGRTAEWAAGEYVGFLPKLWRPLIRVRFNAEGDAELGLLGIPRPMIVLRRSEERSGPDRQVFDIIGGMLLRKGRAYEARFELREVLGGTALIAAIHDYAPALPWRIYQSSQAWAHLWVMRAFSRHLARLLTAGSDASDPASAQGAASH
jgi:uncharacterized protein YbjT (DUF2867 family)